jgi:hypothetical protein
VHKRNRFEPEVDEEFGAVVRSTDEDGNECDRVTFSIPMKGDVLSLEIGDVGILHSIEKSSSSY